MARIHPTDLALLARWERAHQVALLAENAVSDPPAASTAADVWTFSRELRGIADAIFAELLARNAFGRLDPMPVPRRSAPPHPGFTTTAPSPL